MKIDEYYKKVEKVLGLFPREYTNNYYNNKETLTIKKEEELLKGMTGGYDSKKNKITYYKNTSLPHELFHMAFNDREKNEKKLCDGSELYYSNGVSIFRYMDGNKHIFGKGINEGLVQYLSEKCIPTNGRVFEVYFADLLISIYGEDILLYALDNDPIGFMFDERFFDINKFILNLDNLCDSRESIVLIANFIDVFKKQGIEEKDKEIFSIINNINKKYKFSIINLFKSIINEFINCEVPTISKDDFLEKISKFLTKSKYSFAFALDNSECSVKDELVKLIEEFKNNKVKSI